MVWWGGGGGGACINFILASLMFNILDFLLRFFTTIINICTHLEPLTLVLQLISTLPRMLTRAVDYFSN